MGRWIDVQGSNDRVEKDLQLYETSPLSSRAKISDRPVDLHPRGTPLDKQSYARSVFPILLYPDWRFSIPNLKECALMTQRVEIR